MKKLLTYALLLFLALPLGAKVLVSPMEVMGQSFGSGSKITKENILLTNAQISSIESNAKAKLKNKIVRIFKASKGAKNIGYGILIDKKVRSKNCIALYLISSDSKLKAIEIIAFNEPHEYIPSDKWMEQFKNMSANERPTLSKEIPSITGATLSAKSLVDGSRLAFAFYDEILKGK